MTNHREEALLKEYTEAGLICRWYEQLTRTNLIVFLPLATALIGYLLKSGTALEAKLVLSLFGFAVSLLLVNVVFRQRAYYLCYINRAKEVENTLRYDGKPIMRLYTEGETATTYSKTFSNKIAIGFILWSFAIYFIGSGIYYGYRMVCSVLL